MDLLYDLLISLTLLVFRLSEFPLFYFEGIAEFSFNFFLLLFSLSSHLVFMIIKPFLPFCSLRLVFFFDFLSFEIILLHHSCFDKIFSLFMICVVLERAFTVFISCCPLKISLLLFKLLLTLLGDIILFVINAGHLKLVFAKLFFPFSLEFLVKFLLKLFSFSFKLLLQFDFNRL